MRRHCLILLKKALDEIAGSIEMRTEADWIVAIAFWWDVFENSLPPAPFAFGLRGKFRHPFGALFLRPIRKGPHELVVAEGTQVG
jgi:hypothetical protein